MRIPMRPVLLATLAWLTCATGCQSVDRGSRALGWIRPSADRTHFVGAESDARFVVWGVNYDHDASGRLIEDYWRDEWRSVVEDFGEIRDLGANVVRIHLQLGRFMTDARRADPGQLERLARLVDLAETTGLYLAVTGLGCYHKRDVPPWYDRLPEADRWEVQAHFWAAVAKVCRESPAIFCYDLMNEPILPGKTPATEWLAGEFGGKHFVQRIALDLAGRTRQEVARRWVEKMAGVIRHHDERHMITVGVIPWALTFPGAKPLFYSPTVVRNLDFVSVHFYPKKNEVDAALRALQVYEIGKPLVVEEIFPLHCGIDELCRFIDRSRHYVDGWISFYWGRRADEYERQRTVADAMVASWLRRFEAMADTITADQARSKNSATDQQIRRPWGASIRAASSLTSLAATAAVRSSRSRLGLSSTTSAPIGATGRSCTARTTSRTLKPPGSWWDTPGAYAGSTASRSIDTYSGAVSARSRSARQVFIGTTSTPNRSACAR